MVGVGQEALAPMQLTKNFTLSEMTKSQTALRLGLDNTPPQEAIFNLQFLALHVLQPVRDHYARSVLVSSGYRSPELNVRVGGSRKSDHCRGMAADIEVFGIANYDLAAWIAANLRYTQLILEFYTRGVPDSGWVHVSYDSSNLKQQSLTAVKTGDKTAYMPGLHA